MKTLFYKILAYLLDRIMPNYELKKTDTERYNEYTCSDCGVSDAKCNCEYNN